MTVGSLFSGIGGLDLGLQRAGMTIRWQVEIDPFCQRVLAKHWPNMPRYGDVRELTGEELEHVDLVCGGFPCQPVSTAGKRLWQADERWLWPELARLPRVVRPRLVVLENVVGLLAGPMADVLGDLASLGFDAEWSLLSAAEMGAPHLRERVFVLAYDARDLRGTPRHARPVAPDWRRALAADPHSVGRRANIGDLHGRQPDAAGCCQASADHDGLGGGTRPLVASRVRPSGAQPPGGPWWEVEPDVGRVVHGVSDRVDRLRALGNAVVPQCAQWIGERIVAADRAARAEAVRAATRAVCASDSEAVIEYVSALSRRGAG